MIEKGIKKEKEYVALQPLTEHDRLGISFFLRRILGKKEGIKKRSEKKQKIFGENKKVVTFALPFNEMGIKKGRIRMGLKAGIIHNRSSLKD